MMEKPETAKVRREPVRDVTRDELRELIQRLPDGIILEIRIGKEDGRGG